MQKGVEEGERWKLSLASSQLHERAYFYKKRRF